MNIMKHENKNSTNLPELNNKQNRSKKTYNAFIAACFNLLKKREFDSITVAYLSQSAGYSVGAFYGRFRSKDELFDAMIAHHLITRRKTTEHLFSTLCADDIIDELIQDIVYYYRAHQNFWRSALVRSMRDHEFWEPIRQSDHELASRVIDRFSKQANRPLTDLEETNVHFAFQIVLGIINNTIISKPGPIFLNQKLFVEKLTQTFRLLTNYDNIISAHS